ncbi:MAG: AMP-binding protein [Chloroflexi bacterium]|nr:AMP-binding protein [Chloroflexota bacterium]
MTISNDPIGPLAADADTLPKYFLKTAKRLSGHAAIRKKRFGIWQEYTWHASFQHIHDFCLGLVSMGLQRGDKMSIVGDNDPEYYWAELAAQSAGGITIGVFTDATPRELEYVLNNSESVFLLAQDQEQVDHALEIRAKVPNVRRVIYWDEKSLRGYHDDWLISFSGVEALGREYAQNHPGIYEELVAQGNGDDIAILSYTSGTTSLPKGAMVLHRNLIYGSRHVQTLMPVYQNDDYVSFSPLAWITEQSLGLAYHVIDATVVNFPEKAETVQQDIREIAPVTLLFPSRLWESLVSLVQARIADSLWINRWLYNRFLPIGYKLAELEEQGKRPGPILQVLRLIGEMALYAPLRDKLGLSRIRYAYTSGAALSPDVLRFFRAINVDLHQLYGSTECQTHTVHYPGEVHVGTVGKAPPTVEVKLGEDGEIMVKSRSVFAGYYKDEEKTKKALTPDGWFKTGDAGYMDENGDLIYLDRVSDLISLSSGKPFSPQYIEGRLKFSPYIHDTMAVGGFDMPYVSTLITLDFENVARWAEKRGLSFTTMVDLSQRDEIANLIMEDVERTNKTLPEPARIRRFVILPRAFDPDEEELTRTRKLRRRFMEQKYGDILNAIYGGDAMLLVRSEVRYRDGRVGHTEMEVRVRDVGDTQDLPAVKLGGLETPQMAGD